MHQVQSSNFLVMRLSVRRGCSRGSSSRADQDFIPVCPPLGKKHTCHWFSTWAFKGVKITPCLLHRNKQTMICLFGATAHARGVSLVWHRPEPTSALPLGKPHPTLLCEQGKIMGQKGRWIGGQLYVFYVLDVFFLSQNKPPPLLLAGWVGTLHSPLNNCSVSRGWEIQKVKEIWSSWKRYCPWSSDCNDVCPRQNTSLKSRIPAIIYSDITVFPL